MSLLRTWLCALFFISIAFSANANAQSEWISLNGGDEGELPEIFVSTASECAKMFDGDDECIFIKLKLYGFYLDEVSSSDGETYFRIRVPGLSDFSTRVGFPVVPSFATLIQVPNEWESVEISTDLNGNSSVPISELKGFIPHLLAEQSENYLPDYAETETLVPIVFDEIASTGYPSQTYLFSPDVHEWNGAKISNIELFPFRLKQDDGEWNAFQRQFEFILTNGGSEVPSDVYPVSRKMADLVQATVPNFDATKVEIGDGVSKAGKDKTLFVIGGNYNNRADEYRDHPGLTTYLRNKTDWLFVGQSVEDIALDSGYYRADGSWGKSGQVGLQCRILNRILQIRDTYSSTTSPLEAVLLVGDDNEIPLWLEEGHGIVHTNVVKTFGMVIEGWLEVKTPSGGMDDHVLVVLTDNLSRAPGAAHTNWQILIDADRDGDYEWQMDHSNPVPNPLRDPKLDDHFQRIFSTSQGKVNIRIELVEDDTRFNFTLATYNSSATGMEANPSLLNATSGFYTNNIAKLYMPDDDTKPGARVYIKDGIDNLPTGAPDGYIDEDLDLTNAPDDPTVLDHNWTMPDALGNWTRPSAPANTLQELVNGEFQIGFDTINLDSIEFRFQPERGDHAYSLRKLPKYCNKYIANDEEPFDFAIGLTDACEADDGKPASSSESTICGDSFDDFIEEPFVDPLTGGVVNQVPEDGHFRCTAAGDGYVPDKPCRLLRTVGGIPLFNGPQVNCFYGQCLPTLSSWGYVSAYIPDRSVGRWNVKSIPELESYIRNATLHSLQSGYEPSSSYRHLFIAGADEIVNPLDPNDAVNQRYRGLIGAISGTLNTKQSLHSILVRNSTVGMSAFNFFTNPDGVAATNDSTKYLMEQYGIGLLTYYGHGSPNGFAHTIPISEIQNLTYNGTPAKKSHYLVYAETCLTASIQGSNRTIADEFMQNTDNGAIGYLGNAHVQSRDGSLRTISSNVQSLFSLANPTLGDWWESTIVTMGAHHHRRTQKTLFHRVLLGDPTLPLYGFSDDDIDKDGIPNSQDNCLEVSNPTQRNCDYNLAQQSTTGMESIMQLQKDRSYVGASESLDCDVNVENCDHSIVANYTDRLIYRGNACEQDRTQECVFSTNTGGSEEHDPVSGISTYGEYFNESQEFTRTSTVADNSPARVTFDSAYCICSYLPINAANICKRLCPNDPRLTFNPLDPTGWKPIERWFDNPRQRCTQRAANPLNDRHCSQAGTPDNDPFCSNRQQFNFLPSPLINEDKRQLEWTRSTLPDNMHAVDPTTCHLDPADLGNNGVTLGHIRIAYQKVTDPDIVTFTNPQLISLSRSPTPTPAAFPRHLFGRIGSTEHMINSMMQPIEYSATKYYALDISELTDSNGALSESGAFISHYDPRHTIPAAFWNPIHYSDKSMAAGLKDFGVANISLDDVDMPLIYGGSFSSGLPNVDAYIAKKDDGVYLWEKLTDIAGPVKVNSSLHYNPDTNKVWMFGGMTLNSVQPSKSARNIALPIYLDWDHRIHFLDLSSPYQTWREYLTPNDENSTPKFTNMKVAASNSSNILYFYGGRSSTSDAASPVYSFEFKGANWTELDLEPSGPTNSCAAVVRKDAKLFYLIPSEGGGGKLYSYNPTLKTSEFKQYSNEELPDFSGGCHAIYSVESNELIFVGIDKSTRPNNTKVIIDPESLDIKEDHMPCDPTNTDNIEGMLCTKDDKWYQHPGEKVCDIVDEEWECIGPSNDSKWNGSYFAIGNVNGIAKSGDKVYVATDIGLQVVTIAVPYFPIFAGWAYSDGPANDIAFDGDRYAYLADQTGIKIYDVNFSLIPIIQSNFFTNQPVRSLRLNGDTLYIVTSNQLILLNVSDVRSPVEIIRITIDDVELSDVDITDSYAYVAGQRGVHVIKTVDTNNPQYIDKLVTSRAIRRLKTDGQFLYLLDDIYQQHSYIIREKPWDPPQTISHSVTGWVNGVERDSQGRSVGYIWNWMEVRKNR